MQNPLLTAIVRIGLLLVGACLITASSKAQESGPLGIFEGQNDVGNVLHAGSAEYDSTTKKYVISGSGENMWLATDEFHFVWKKISSKDVTLTADVSILGDQGNGHRKGVLMIRQSLDTDSAYVDVARHGEGLTSLQFRDNKGAITREVESAISGPTRLRLEKQSDRFYMWIANGNEDLQFAGGSAKVEFHAPFYVGIGVCAHDKNAVQKVEFSNVELKSSVNHPKAKYSTVETVLQSGDARVGYVSRDRLTSPGWSADGQAITFKMKNKQQQAPFVPLRTAAKIGTPLPGWSQQKSENGEGSMRYPSPDGKLVVFLTGPSNEKHVPKKKDIELQMTAGGNSNPKTLAKFVGGQGSLGMQPWSPDGKRIVFISYQEMK